MAVLEHVQTELDDKGPYQINIGAMRLRLQELQKYNSKAHKIRVTGLQESWEQIDRVFYYKGLLYLPKIVRFALISKHYNDPLVDHFGVDKTRKLIGRKYYWLSLRKDIETYVKGYDICLASKAVKYKLYGDLQSLPISTHQWKDLLIHFFTGLPISTDWKGNSYDSILVIIDWLTKMVHYELVKIFIHAPELVKVILDIVVWHHGFFNSIVSDRGSLFTSKFWSSFCYFFGIKDKLLTAFYPQMDSQTKG